MLRLRFEDGMYRFSLVINKFQTMIWSIADSQNRVYVDALREQLETSKASSLSTQSSS